MVRSTPGSVTKEAESTSQEEDWIARARTGDREAYRKLVERYQNRAYALALRILRSEPEAEEAAQDGFVRAWRGLPSFQGQARFSTWLYRIVLRCALDRVDRLKLRRSREAPLEEAAQVTAGAGFGSSRGAGMAQAEGGGPRAARLLELLSDVERAAVLLYYFEDRSVQEVARTLGMPEGTVKTHLYRARARMRAAWMEQERRSEPR